MALPPNWSQFLDPKTETFFYYNALTKKTQWDMPELDVSMPAPAPPASPPPPPRRPKREQRDVYERRINHESGEVYFTHVATKLSYKELPPGGILSVSGARPVSMSVINPRVTHSREQAAIIVTRCIRSVAIFSKWHRLVRDYVAHPDSQPAKKRNKVLWELVETERTYVAGLTTLKTHFRDVMQELVSAKEWGKDITDEDVVAIFSVAVNIHALHTQLLSDFEEQAARFPNWRLCACLSSLGPYMKMYVGFCNNYDTSLQRIHHCRQRNDAFAKWLGKQEELYCGGQKLDSLLITIIQRTMRYRMLLLEAKTVTPKNHVEFAEIEKALTTISEVAIYLNERRRFFEHMWQLIELQNLILDCNDLVAPTRKLEHEGRVACVLSTKPTKVKFRHLIVCNDQLLVVHNTNLRAEGERWGARDVGMTPVMRMRMAFRAGRKSIADHIGRERERDKEGSGREGSGREDGDRESSCSSRGLSRSVSFAQRKSYLQIRLRFGLDAATINCEVPPPPHDVSDSEEEEQGSHKRLDFGLMISSPEGKYLVLYFGTEHDRDEWCALLQRLVREREGWLKSKHVVVRKSAGGNFFVEEGEV